MSWFSEIAGKAEDLLNRVDQGAATALQNKVKTPTHEHKLINHTMYSNEPYNSNQVYPAPLKNHNSSVSGSPIQNKASKNSGLALKQQQWKDSDDEQLLQFLNNGEALPTPQRLKQKEVPPQKIFGNSESEVLEKSNSMIDSSVHNNGTMPCPSITDEVDSGNVHKKLPEAKELYTIGTSDNLLETSRVSTSEQNSSSDYFQEEFQRKHDKGKRWTPSQTDCQNMPISDSDKAIRELREREKDLIAALDAKDAQLAVLKVRLQEADQELQAKSHVAKNLETENDRMIKEHAQSASFQNKTIEVLQEQVRQAELDLNKATESLRQHQNEHMQKMAKTEEEHRLLVDSYTSLQKKWTDLNDRSKEMSIQLKQSNGNFDALQQEYNDYKQKAQRILQSKEKLITSLKGGHFEAASIERSEAASALLNAEVEGVKQERDLIRDELRRANELVDSYRAEIQELEKVSHNDSVASHERCQNLKEQLSSEKTQKEESQLMNTQLKEELQILRDELARSKTSFQSRIQDREIEIEKLRRQLTAKSLSTVSQDELESRLHALTENLIQKQTLVESLSTEKNSLVLQLERMDQHLREAQNYNLHQHAYVGINNNDSERKAKAVFLENPFDSALTRKVKKVYGSIDSLSIRLGVFFRRYPITRVFVFIYMLLLHFWVMIVLLTYEPEIHSAGYEVPQSQ